MNKYYLIITAAVSTFALSSLLYAQPAPLTPPPAPSVVVAPTPTPPPAPVAIVVPTTGPVTTQARVAGLESYSGSDHLILPVNHMGDYIKNFSIEIVPGNDQNPDSHIEIHGFAPKRCLPFLKIGRAERVAEAQRYEVEIYAKQEAAPNTFEACYQGWQAETQGRCLRNRGDDYACEDVSGHFQAELANLQPSLSGDIFLCAQSPVLGVDPTCQKASQRRWVSAEERQRNARNHEQLVACESAEGGNSDGIERLRVLAREETGASSTQLLELAERFTQERTEREARDLLTELDRAEQLPVANLREAEEKMTRLVRLSERLRSNADARTKISEDLLTLARRIRNLQQDNLNADNDLDSDDDDMDDDNDSSGSRSRSRRREVRQTVTQFNMKKFALIENALKSAQHLGSRDADLLRRQNAIERLAYAAQDPDANYTSARSMAMRAMGGAVTRATHARNGDQSYARFLQDASRVTGITAANLQNPSAATQLDMLANQRRAQSVNGRQSAYAFQGAYGNNLNTMLSPFANLGNPQAVNYQQQMASMNNMSLNALRSPASMPYGFQPAAYQQLQFMSPQQQQLMLMQQQQYSAPAFMMQQQQYAPQYMMNAQPQYYMPQVQQAPLNLGLGYSFNIGFGS